MKVYFKTFGCRVNQYETQTLRENLLCDGDEEVSDFLQAELCVVNTCTVTRAADRDALQLLRRITKRNPAARVVVLGCGATRAPEELRTAAPSALVVGHRDRDRVRELLGLPEASFHGIRGAAGRARALVKVQDGCDRACAYCIVPVVRPSVSSRPLEEVSLEVEGLVGGGFREIVLCGIRLGRYEAPDARGTDLAGLTARLVSLPGDFRVRFSSLEFDELSDPLIGLAARSEGRLCPSFHLPLQSGSDRTLARMGRWYTAGEYSKRVEALRKSLPGAGLFTDVMVGFPGETREDFETTVAVIRELRFSGLHVFRYSKRQGTRAAEMPDQVPAEESAERAETLRKVDRELRRRFANEAVGSRRRVLVEERGEEVTATTDHFLRVRLERDPGEGFAWARVSAVKGDLALATVEQ